MAIARCDQCGKPKGKTQTYVAKAVPAGYPNVSTICGSKDCDNSANVWLNEAEKNLFDRGQRVFRFPTFAAKVRVEKIADAV